MVESLFVAASVFIPLAFGLVPGFLPPSVPAIGRWVSWLAVVVGTGWYVHLLRDAPSPFPLMALVFLVVSAGLSLVVLVVDTNRAPAPRRR